jgi:hypothetical protein
MRMLVGRLSTLILATTLLWAASAQAASIGQIELSMTVDGHAGWAWSGTSPRSTASPSATP